MASKRPIALSIKLPGSGTAAVGLTLMLPGIDIVTNPPFRRWLELRREAPTNQTRSCEPDAAKFVAKAKERGVLAVAFGPRIVRVVTHLDVTSEQCEQAASILAAVAEGR